MLRHSLFLPCSLMYNLICFPASYSIRRPNEMYYYINEMTYFSGLVGKIIVKCNRQIPPPPPFWCIPIPTKTKVRLKLFHCHTVVMEWIVSKSPCKEEHMYSHILYCAIAADCHIPSWQLLVCLFICFFGPLYVLVLAWSPWCSCCITVKYYNGLLLH